MFQVNLRSTSATSRSKVAEALHNLTKVCFQMFKECLRAASETQNHTIKLQTITVAFGHLRHRLINLNLSTYLDTNKHIANATAVLFMPTSSF